MNLFFAREASTEIEQLVKTLEPKVPARFESAPPRETLDLGELHCLSIRDNRSSRGFRTPLVFPFFLDSHHSQHLLASIPPEVDWLYLGGREPDFRGVLKRFLRAREIETVSLVPFGQFSGTLSRHQLPDEPVVQVLQPHGSQNEETVSEQLDELLNTPVAQWGDRFGNTLVLNDAWDQCRRFIEEEKRSPKRMIDLGSGLGGMVLRAARDHPEAHVTGIDLSVSSITACSRKIIAPNALFLVGAMESLPFLTSGSADFVFSVSAINQAQQQEGVAREVCRILSDGGALFARVYPESYFAFWNFPASLVTPPTTGFIRSVWEDVASENGLVLEARESEFNLGNIAALNTPDVQESVAKIDSQLAQYDQSRLHWAAKTWFAMRTTGTNTSPTEVAKDYHSELESALESVNNGPAELQSLARKIWKKNFQRAGYNQACLDYIGFALPSAKASLRQAL